MIYGVASLVIKSVEIESPGSNWNCVPDFPHLVPLSRDRQDVEAVPERELEHRPGHSRYLRMLIEPPVGCTEDGAPPQREGDSESGTGAMLRHCACKPFETESQVQGQAGSRAICVLGECGHDSRPQLLRFRQRQLRARR